MTQDDIVEHIRSIHSRCCLTHKSGERNCSLNIRGFDSSSLVMLDGTLYQKEHGYVDRLCDRIVFGRWQDTNFVGAVELKGGKNVNLRQAVDQIQNGLTVAENCLSGHSVTGWYPVLLFSGHLGGIGTTKLRTSRLALPTLRRNPPEIIKRDCGSSLTAILEQNSQVY